MRSLILIATLAATLFSLAASARAQSCQTSCTSSYQTGRDRVCTTRCN